MVKLVHEIERGYILERRQSVHSREYAVEGQWELGRAARTISMCTSAGNCGVFARRARDDKSETQRF
jgi:hypothetical protein